MTRKEFVKHFKRFFIVFICCLPVLILLGVLLNNLIPQWLMVMIFILIAGTAYLVEELIYLKNAKNRELEKEKRKLKKQIQMRERKREEQNGKG